MPPIDPGHSATVLVALAATDGTPSQTSVGNEMSVPPPATALMAPAATAAAKTTSSCIDDTAYTVENPCLDELPNCGIGTWVFLHASFVDPAAVTGMSRPLLKFGGGSVEILRDVFH